MKNSERSIKDTYRIKFIAFPNVRKDNEGMFINDDLLNNPEALKYNEAIYPTKESIEKHKQYICDYVLLRDAHQVDPETKDGEEQPREEIGWITDLEYSDKFSSNTRWFTALIFTARLHKQKADGLMLKYGFSSLYGFRFSISFYPIAENYEENGQIYQKVVDTQFTEVSITPDPAFYKCRTVFVYQKNTNNGISDSNKYFNKNKKYIVSCAALPQKTFNVTLTMSSGTEVPIANPETTQQPGQTQVQTPAPVQTQVQNSATTPPAQPPPAQQGQQATPAQPTERFQLLKKAYGIDMPEILKSNNVKVLQTAIEKISGSLCQYMTVAEKKAKNFIQERDVDHVKHLNNFKFGRSVTKNDEDQFNLIYYSVDVVNPMNHFLKLQSNYVEQEKKKLELNTQLPSTNLSAGIQGQPQQQQQGTVIPITTGGLKKTTNEVIPIVNFSALIEERAPQEGTSEWKRMLAKSGGFQNYRGGMNFV